MFGNGIASHFMIPYCKKFWGVDPKKLTTDWVNIRHPKPTLEEVISGALYDQKKGFGINAVFRYPRKGGFGFIAKALAQKCQERINLNMKATCINTKDKEITFNNTKVIPYDQVISTIPLPDLINLIPDAPQEVIEATKKLKTNSIFVVNIGVKRKNISDKSWIYFLEKNLCFFRVSFPCNFTKKVNSLAPEGHSSISVEIAYGNNNKLPKKKDELTNLVIKDLIKTGILEAKDEIVFLSTCDIKYAYVVFDKERKPAIKKIHNYLKTKNIMPCGRYGLWAYLWSDEAILSGKKAAENVLKYQ